MTLNKSSFACTLCVMWKIIEFKENVAVFATLYTYTEKNSSLSPPKIGLGSGSGSEDLKFSVCIQIQTILNISYGSASSNSVLLGVF